MQLASFNGFLKSVIYFIAFYYIFKFLAKLFLPLLAKKVIEKAGQNFQKHQQTQYSSRQTSATKDEVFVDTSKGKKSPDTNNVGEYVDYEEIN